MSRAKKILETGAQYVRLFVLGPLGGDLWKCRCECGTCIATTKKRLVKYRTTSCGCLFKEYKLNQWRFKRFASNKNSPH